MKKADLILIAAVMIMAAVIFLLGKIIISNSDEHASVVVKYDNEVYGIYSLHNDGEFRLNINEGYNILVIKDNECYISESDCENKICIHTGNISNIGDTICCLPHKLIVYVE